jgi:hypothetical protein
MADRDTLAILAGEVGLAVQPLAAALVSPGAFRDFLEDLGWSFDTVPDGLNALSGPVSTLVNLVGDGQVDPSEIQPLLNAVLALFQAIANLNSAGDLWSCPRRTGPPRRWRSLSCTPWVTASASLCAGAPRCSPRTSARVAA